MEASFRHRADSGKSRLDSARFRAPPSVARAAGKSVVHSSNNLVTRRRGPTCQASTATVFHDQVIDFKEYSDVGTFLANPHGGPTFPAFRAREGIHSTDLSTTGVDKPESPFISVSYVMYVMFEGRMARNCHAGCPGSRPHFLNPPLDG